MIGVTTSSKRCIFCLKMVKRCIAAVCSNIARENVSLWLPARPCFKRSLDHVFIIYGWTKQVRRTRDGWSGPTPYVFVCSDHFTEDCFETYTFMAQKLGIKKRKRLKPDAVVPNNISSSATAIFPSPLKKENCMCNTKRARIFASSQEDKTSL